MLRKKLERLQRSHLLLQGSLFWILWRHLNVLLMKSKAVFNFHRREEREEKSMSRSRSIFS